MTDYERAKAQVERIAASATDLMQRDMRVRMLVDSSVKFAADEHGPIDPEDAAEVAHHIARRAAAILYARVYDEDGELRGLTAERDAYRERTLELCNFMPRIIVADTPNNA